MVNEIISRAGSPAIQETIDREVVHLRALKDTDVKRAGAWSPKEELGHLIDSATNNHVRFVRAALEDDYSGPGYAQDAWVSLHGYDETAWPDLVELWYRYNTLLARLVSRIPESRLGVGMTVSNVRFTLGFAIEDYVLHLQHHVDHILSREVITVYPSQRLPT